MGWQVDIENGNRKEYYDLIGAFRFTPEYFTDVVVVRIKFMPIHCSLPLLILKDPTQPTNQLLVYYYYLGVNFQLDKQITILSYKRIV